MSESTSRRRVLKALAAASAVPVSGCASIVDAVGSSSQASSDGGEVPESNGSQLSKTETPTAAENVSGPSEDTETQTATEWSIDDVTIEAPSASLSSVTLPDDRPQYPTMGDGDETVTVYGSWKCPYTQEFVLDQLPALVDEFVRPGDVSIQFQAVAYRGGEPFLGVDAPKSTRAGLAVWETDPESFWNYFTYVFANQPDEQYRWGQPELLTRFAAAADVENPSAVRQAASEEDAYTERIQQTLTSANENDIWTVPRVVYDGEVTAPTLDAESTREQLREAADE